MGLLQTLFQKDQPAAEAVRVTPVIESTPSPTRRVLDFRNNAVLMRRFSAATRDRLNYSWKIGDNGINQDIFLALRVLRMMSRDLCQNNPNGRRWLRMTENGVVGPRGFALHFAVTGANGDETKPDIAANKALEKAFWQWAQKGVCEVSGKMSFTTVCRTVVRALARDGEALIIKKRGKKYNRFGFGLQLIDADRLDIQKNGDAPSGNPIRMGVEYDAETLRPVAYWILNRHPGDPMSAQRRDGQLHTRMEAKDVYHLFLPDRPEQMRGFPWLHAVIETTHQLGEFEKSALINARIGAAKMGFYTTPDGDPDALADEEESTGTGNAGEGELLETVEPGVFSTLPPGYDFKEFNPQYPNEVFAHFIKSFLRKIASGTDVAYNNLANDLENVNFSSIRSGTLEERDNFMALQEFVIEELLNDVISDWLQMALVTEQVLLPSGKPLPSVKFDKFNVAVWRGRRWQWVDPRSEMTANQIAVGNRMKSLRRVMEEQGFDFDEEMAQIIKEQEQLRAAGLSLPTAPDASNIANGDKDDETGKTKNTEDA